MSKDAVDKSRSLAFIPVVILLFIGGIQIYLGKTTNLTPWKGGGFGMFSTTDGAANRSLRVFGTGPDQSEELLLEASSGLCSCVQKSMWEARSLCKWTVPRSFCRTQVALRISAELSSIIFWCRIRGQPRCFGESDHPSR
jgi:hypothetical protein